MRVLKIVVLTFIFTAAAHAQHTSHSIDFYMHDRYYDTFLRDHYRFEEPKPLHIEYWYVNWLDSAQDVDEYKDHLHLEGLVPIYLGKKLIVDIPFQYSRVPIWAETEETTFGSGINVLQPNLIARWTLTNRLKSIIGWEYNLKGDGEFFGKSNGRVICPLKAVFSYDLNTQLNFAAGARFDRYYYDIHEPPDVSFKLADRLYCQPIVMLNWHPSNDFAVLLGIPGLGVHLGFGDMLKTEARVSIDRKFEIAFRAKPFERTNVTLRMLNVPYTEIPVESHSFHEGEILAERLCCTDRSILLEIGRELNPAALASLGLRYGFGGDVELKDRDCKEIIKLNGKPHFAIGVTFTVDIEALAGIR